MEKRRIEIRGIDAPGKERWGAKKGEAEMQRSQKIMARLNEEEKRYPGADIKIEYRNGDFFLCVTTKEDLAMEQRFLKAKEIYEKRGESAHRAEVRRAFLY